MSSNIENDRSDIIQYIHKPDIYYYKQAQAQRQINFLIFQRHCYFFCESFCSPPLLPPQQFLKKPFYYQPKKKYIFLPPILRRNPIPFISLSFLHFKSYTESKEGKQVQSLYFSGVYGYISQKWLLLYFFFPPTFATNKIIYFCQIKQS